MGLDGGADGGANNNRGDLLNLRMVAAFVRGLCASLNLDARSLWPTLVT